MTPLSEPQPFEEEIQQEETPKENPIAIYNNGVPSLVCTTEQDIYNILHGIEDPMECYPPDAQDAAELEACEAFVETMAFLAMLEEREERARNDFSHIQKRWEVRRQQGLNGKRPKPAKHSIKTTPHLQRCAVQHNVHSLVKALPQHHKSGAFAPARLSLKTKQDTIMHVMHRPIQQPRKHY